MDILIPLIVFFVCVPLAGMVLATYLPGGSALERWVAGVGAALLAIYLLGFGSYVVGLPRWLWWVWPAAATVGLVFRQAECRALINEPETRQVAYSWGLFACWGLGLLLCIQAYGGGGWCADWIEHFHRAELFRLGLPATTRFINGIYSLGARPPMGNVIDGLLLQLSGTGFTRYIVANMLCGSLLMLPAALLARAWAPHRPGVVIAAVLVVLMLNPMTAQNLAYAWTRHLCAFWVLLGTHLLLRGLVRGNDTNAQRLGWLALAAGVLTHYSAGPYVVIWLGAYLWIRRRHWTSAGFWLETSWLGAVSVMLLAMWFAWAWHAIGPSDTFGSNTTATAASKLSIQQNLHVFAMNLRDTLVPHPLRDLAPSAVPDQISRAGRLRDFLFNIYQVNLPLMLGFGGLTTLLLLLGRAWRVSAGWYVALAGVVSLGVAVHTMRDFVGLGHICLQPLVLFGLIRVAAFLGSGPVSALVLWMLLSVIDATLGIGLSFALQTLWFATADHYNIVAQWNAYAHETFHFNMPRTNLAWPNLMALALLVSSLGAAILQWKNVGRLSHPKSTV